jgi:hypothetical protein
MMSGGKDLIKAKLARRWIIVAVGLVTLNSCTEGAPYGGGYFPAYAGTAYPAGSLGLGGFWLGNGQQHHEWRRHGEWHHPSAPEHRWHRHRGDWSGKADR